MHFLSPLLENYLADHSQPEPKLLQELTRETHLKVIQPRMLTGHFQGRVLSLLSKLIHPANILEIGTYTGYSALCLAEGLQKNGQLHTIDVNAELEQIQRTFFDRSDFGNITNQSSIGVELNPLATRKDIWIGSFDEIPVNWYSVHSKFFL